MHLKAGKQRRKQISAQKETYGYKQKKNKRETENLKRTLPHGLFASFIWRSHSHSLFGIKTLTVYYTESNSQFIWRFRAHSLAISLGLVFVFRRSERSLGTVLTIMFAALHSFIDCLHRFLLHLDLFIGESVFGGKLLYLRQFVTLFICFGFIHSFVLHIFFYFVCLFSGKRITVCVIYSILGATAQ
jgi:hypothetical protein